MQRCTHKLKISVVTLLAIFSLSACMTTKTPIPTLNYSGSEKAQQQSGKKLLVVLRGMGGNEKSYEKYGFIDALQRRYPEFDVAVPNAHFGYYRNRTIKQRLSEDIIDPAIERGYEEIWLAGVSMGGLGSLLYMRCCQEKITGVVLIAPYSGKEKLHKQISAHLDSGQEPPWSEIDKSEDSILGLWRWMVEDTQLLSDGRVWLGYGDKDRLSGHDLLSRLMPEERVAKIPGGHKVEVFMQIWDEILSRDPMGRQHAAAMTEAAKTNSVGLVAQ